jgi:hypothetical protein
MGVYTLVGQLSVRWSLLEFAMDVVVATLCHRLAGKNLVRKIPLDLSGKITFIRSCLDQVPALSSYLLDGVRLLDEVSTLRNVRHGIVHGYFSAYSDDRKAFTFVRLSLERGKTHHVVHEQIYTAEQLLQVGYDVGQVSAQFSKFAERLLVEFDPDGAAGPILHSSRV